MVNVHTGEIGSGQIGDEIVALMRCEKRQGDAASGMCGSQPGKRVLDSEAIGPVSRSTGRPSPRVHRTGNGPLLAGLDDWTARLLWRPCHPRIYRHAAWGGACR